MVDGGCANDAVTSGERADLFVAITGSVLAVRVVVPSPDLAVLDGRAGTLLRRTGIDTDRTTDLIPTALWGVV